MNKGHVSKSAAFFEALASEKVPRVQSMGRRQRRAAETRVRLFRCALQLFAERGYPNVTVEDITEAADVGKGTFFNYFESKDRVLSVMAEIQLGEVKEALTLAEAGEQTIRSVLHHLFLRSAEEPGRSPDLARALLSSFLASEGMPHLMAHNMAAEGRKMLTQIIAAGQRRREIDARLKKEKVALQVQQAFMGTLLLWSLDGQPALEAWAEESFQHFWRAVAASDHEQKR
ncbi:MAG TPA: TetR/AcrR family transcriptional regulator [Candidatus Aquilonibacter sp.]|nr:TetR/AcrR family transcriptional regulator [Candidatus Aquilonibacter sp.]